MRPMIEVEGLRKRYGPGEVLCGVDLSVRAGSIFCLLGPNGAGKTTMVRIMATLAEPSGGHVRINGFDVQQQRSAVRKHIGVTGQYATLDDVLTGEENLFMLCRLARLRRSDAKRRTDELLEQFDLTAAAHKRVATYSGGMRRRLDLAASLVRTPAVLFLDEPTTGLDPRSRQVMWSETRRLVDSGMTVFLTTQYLEEADALADHIAVLHKGTLVAEGTSAELKRDIGDHQLRVTLSSPVDFANAQREWGGQAMSCDVAARTIALPTDGSAAHVRDLLNKLDPTNSTIASFEVVTPTLDDVFMSLTGTVANTGEIQESAHV